MRRWVLQEPDGLDSFLLSDLVDLVEGKVAEEKTTADEIFD